MKREVKTEYNVRIVDNGDKTYSIGFVSRFKETPKKKDIYGEWVKGSLNKVVRLLKKGRYVDES